MGIVYSGVVFNGDGGDDGRNEAAALSSDESSEADECLRLSFLILMMEPLGEFLSVATDLDSK
jgi:hypothetical protein